MSNFSDHHYNHIKLSTDYSLSPFTHYIGYYKKPSDVDLDTQTDVAIYQSEQTDYDNPTAPLTINAPYGLYFSPSQILLLNNNSQLLDDVTGAPQVELWLTQTPGVITGADTKVSVTTTFADAGTGTNYLAGSLKLDIVDSLTQRYAEKHFTLRFVCDAGNSLTGTASNRFDVIVVGFQLHSSIHQAKHLFKHP